MDEKVFETIITNSIKIGCIQTLAQLGMLDETVTEKQAYKMYGERLVKQWRQKRWIVGYSTGNTTRAKFSFKRSELELASRMDDLYNVFPSHFLNKKENQFEYDKARIKEIKKRQ